MSVATEISPPTDSRLRWRTAVALLVLILFNLALAAGVRTWLTSARAVYTGVVSDGVLYAQILLLGLCAALAIRSWIISVVVVSVLALIRTLVEQSLPLNFDLSNVLMAALLPLVYLAFFYQLRVFLGWRISRHPVLPSPAAQFHIQDLMLCMVMVSLPCAVGACVRTLHPELQMGGILLYVMVGQAVMALQGTPVALALLSSSRIKVWQVAMVVALILLSLLGWIGLEWVFQPRQFPKMIGHLVWYVMPISVPVYLSTIVANALYLRRLGFRWQAFRATVEENQA